MAVTEFIVPGSGIVNDTETGSVPVIPGFGLYQEQAAAGSVSPSISPSLSPSISPSESPSVSPSASVSPSISPSVSISPSISPSESPSVSPSASISPSISPSPSCPIDCAGCADCIKVTIAGLSGTCSGEDCSNFNGSYELSQVGDTCEWSYTSGNLVISITCSGDYWLLKVVNNAVECAVWRTSISEDPDCPPTS